MLVLSDKQATPGEQITAILFQKSSALERKVIYFLSYFKQLNISQ
jgi:hypothetical protein